MPRVRRPAWDPKSPLLAELDRDQVTDVGTAIALAVREHMRRRPGKASILEVLNALAIVAGTVIQGTGADARETHAWFDAALDQQVTSDGRGGRGNA